MSPTQHKDVVIIGAGLSGLAAASELNDHAVVLEKNPKPGGLVQSVCFNGYWFDHVLHLLYFNNKQTEKRIKNLLGTSLANCGGKAVVESLSGNCRFPIQLHLSSLPKNIVAGCLQDIAELTYREKRPYTKNFKDWLLNTFGNTLCNEFMLPYNNKMWKRPLQELVPANFNWNITRPDFKKVVQGALETDKEFDAYNSNGWYPRPPADSPVRGMGYLSHMMSREITGLRHGHTIKNIHVKNRSIDVESADGNYTIKYEHCIATCPLPQMSNICDSLPDVIRSDLGRLRHNCVTSVALNIRGKKPDNSELWRYYADENIIFTRLIFMHIFDPLSSPENGWGLLVELTHRAEDSIIDESELTERVVQDIMKVGILSDADEILEINIMTADPAYVVFNKDTQAIIEKAQNYLEKNSIHTLGRYGRWEYSSMSQVITDGYALGKKLNESLLGVVL
ncbi:hypothetical protein MNBD_GAMMA11-2530 [hydrothermal vent metagenome]|uniref:Amine oxidase domain-containing protein n=1 Tax=hydrothermal vent metagenome TaxID=652676 RepID=A0A3B0XA73_9ZZZZ